MIRLIIEYIQCYWQAFGLGMLTVFIWDIWNGRKEVKRSRV
jgi:hypothetical protein